MGVRALALVTARDEPWFSQPGDAPEARRRGVGTAGMSPVRGASSHPVRNGGTHMTMDPKAALKDWPDESREAAQLVIDTYGDPDEVTASLLTWHKPGPWKRVIASRTFYQHDFPAPHIDAVESVVDYQARSTSSRRSRSSTEASSSSGRPVRSRRAATTSRR